MIRKTHWGGVCRRKWEFWLSGVAGRSKEKTCGFLVVGMVGIGRKLEIVVAQAGWSD